MLSSLLVLAVVGVLGVLGDTTAFQPSGGANNYVQQYPASSGAQYPPSSYQYPEPAPGGYGVQTGYEGYLTPIEEDEGLLSSWGGLLPRTVLLHFLPKAGAIAGKIALFLLGSATLLFIGTVFTIGVCTFTPICKLTIFGWPFSKETMRSYITPDRLTQATILVRQAIDKYRDMQKDAYAGDKREGKEFSKEKEGKEKEGKKKLIE